MSLRSIRQVWSWMIVCALIAFSSVRASAFNDGFDASGCLEEAGNLSESSNPDWWVNSGGRFCRQSSLGATVQGSLLDNDKWRLLYASSNPTDTDNGYHPQNIFRFVERGFWQDVQQTVHFRIRKLNMSSSPNRNSSNGVLFFHHYQDGDNLYYAGIRVDGAAVIKKKINGTYYTMAYRSGVYPGGTYNATTNPNLIPVDRWIGLRTVIENGAGNATTTVRLELEDSTLGAGWVPIVEAEDTGQYGGAPITAAGHTGIRTDFMDVDFDNYEALDVLSPAPTATPTATATPRPTATPQPTQTPQPTATPPSQPTATMPPAPTPTPPVACSYSVSPLNQIFAAGGGSAASSVQATAGCGWTAKSSASWLTITAGVTGTGNGTVAYSAAANTSNQSRSATVTVAGATISVSQAKPRARK